MNITINNPKIVVVRDSTSLTKQQQNINKHIDTLVHLAKQSVLSEGNYRTPRHVFIKQEQKCTNENQTPNVQMALVNEAFDIVNLDENEVDNQMYQSEAKNGAITLDLVSDNEDETTSPAEQFNKPLESWTVTNVTNKGKNDDENKTIASASSRNRTRVIADNENADEEREVDENTSAITNAPTIDNRSKQVVIPNSTDDAVSKKRKPGRPFGTFRKKTTPNETDFGIGECKNREVDDSQNSNILEDFEPQDFEPQDFEPQDFEPQDFDDVDWDALGHKLLM
jgi:hypothetical protein